MDPASIQLTISMHFLTECFILYLPPVCDVNRDIGEQMKYSDWISFLNFVDVRIYEAPQIISVFGPSQAFPFIFTFIDVRQAWQHLTSYHSNRLMVIAFDGPEERLPFRWNDPFVTRNLNHCDGASCQSMSSEDSRLTAVDLMSVI